VTHVRPKPAEYRYAAVLLLTLVTVVWLILTPSADWSRAVAFALQGMALVIVVGTSREREDRRRLHTAFGAVVAGALVLAVGTGVLPYWAAMTGGGVLSIAIPCALVGGLLRLVRTRGVTLQAVAGSLAIYLLVGLAFAWFIGLVAAIGDAAYFTSGSDGTVSTHVYFSFTVLSTTGFGDFTAATSTGRAMAVVEMLGGQLYLVTVLGVVIGSFGRRR
jgi:Ion channel